MYPEYLYIHSPPAFLEYNTKNKKKYKAAVCSTTVFGRWFVIKRSWFPTFMDLWGLKCSTKQLEFLPQLPLAAEGGISQLQLQKTSSTSITNYTCILLSPTTGSLPTAHCWQSTMHCPDSAKWGESWCEWMWFTHTGNDCPLKWGFIFSWTDATK